MYIIEPIAFLIYVGALTFYAWKIDGKSRYKVLSGYYFMATILLTWAAFIFHSSSTTRIYNILYLITSLGLGFYFFSLLRDRWKKFIAIISGLATLLYFITNTDEIYFDSIWHVIASTGIVVLIFLYLHQIMNNVTEEPLSLNFDFWYVCIQLMYHLGSFAIFLSYNHFTYRYFSAGSDIKEVGQLLTYLWGVHNVLLFLGSLLTWFGILWIVYRRRSMLL